MTLDSHFGPPPPCLSTGRVVDASRRSPAIQRDYDPLAADLAVALEGAGLSVGDVTPELAHLVGQIIRVAAAGVMDVMQSQRGIRDEFRMRLTHFGPKDINPLTFSASVDDALRNLLVKPNAAHLDPVEAFEDAFAALRHHELAMLVAIRVAFEAGLAEFDPDRLQQEFARQGGAKLLPSRLRYWDLFRDMYRELAKDPEASFRSLFGETFARAYEEQLSQLKATERPPHHAPPRGHS